MIAGLHAEGHSYMEIARQAGVSKTTVWRFANEQRDHRGSTLTRIEGFSRTKNVSQVERK